MNEGELAAVIDGLPNELAVWNDGPPALARLLAMCTLERLREQADLMRAGIGPLAQARTNAEREDPRFGDHRDRWRHTVATVIEWAAIYGIPEPRPVLPIADPSRPVGRAGRRDRRLSARGVTVRDYEVAVSLAYDYHELDPIRVGCRTGDIKVVRAIGRNVWITNTRRADIEALDVLLADVSTLPPRERPDAKDPVTDWFKSVRLAPPGSRLPGPRHPAGLAILNSMPKSVRLWAWTETEEDLRAQGSTVGDDLNLGGITFAEARSCYAFLLSQTHLNTMGAFHLGLHEATLWGVRPDQLLGMLSERVDRKVAAAFLRLCTFTKGRSPVSAPLIPSGELFLVPSELVSPIAFERTLLRASAGDPSVAGKLGNVLGSRASRWAERLRSVPGCQVASELPVRSPSGQSMGDLDVVAWDATTSTLAVFETKWPIDAATLAESNKVDATFDKGVSQLKKVRTALASGEATVVWPRSWDLNSATWSWLVGSAQQLDSRSICEADGIERTSLRMLEQLLPATSLDDLLGRLRNFPLPRLGIEFELRPCEVPAGPLRVHYEGLMLHADRPAPSPERRIFNGWT